MSLLTARPKFLATEDEMKTLLCVACLMPACDAFRCSGQRGDLYCRGCLDRWNSAERVEPDDWCCSYDYDSEQEKSPRPESGDSVNDRKDKHTGKSANAHHQNASDTENKKDIGEEEMADDDKDVDPGRSSRDEPFNSDEKNQANVDGSDEASVNTGCKIDSKDQETDKEDNTDNGNGSDTDNEDAEEITHVTIAIGDSRALWKALEKMHDKATYIRGYSERVVDLRMENISMIFHEPNSEKLTERMKEIKKMAGKIIDEANVLKEMVEKTREAVEWNRSSAKALADWMYKVMLPSDDPSRKFTFVQSTAASTEPPQQFPVEKIMGSPVQAVLVSGNEPASFDRKRLEKQFARIDDEADGICRFLDLLMMAGEKIVTAGDSISAMVYKALDEIRHLAEHPSALKMRMPFISQLPAECQRTMERLLGKTEEVDAGIYLLTHKFAPEVYVPLRIIRKTAKWVHSALVIVQEAMCRMSRPEKLPDLAMVPDQSLQKVVRVGAARRGCMVCRKVGDYKESPGANFGVDNLPVECTFTGDDGKVCDWIGRYADFASHTHRLVVRSTAADATSATAGCSCCGGPIDSAARMSKGKQFYHENICSLQ